MSVLVQELRKESFFERLVQKKIFWVIFISLAFAFPFVKALKREVTNKLPYLGAVPTFSFLDENGKSFGSKDLKDKVYIASFFFTSCPTVCPPLLEKLRVVQKRVRGLGRKVAILSFTVDPETDTSGVLFKRAREVKANPYIWKFLTGDEGKLKNLLVGGFKVPMEKNEEHEGDPSMMEIAHSQKLVLVDTEGNIRGYYSIDKVSIDQLMIDLGLLANGMIKS